METKKIVVTPYNSEWPKIFEEEAFKIQEALGEHCVALHHAGSTSVPGLLAKPVIDIIAAVKGSEGIIPALENIGFKYKGEYNIPMRMYFNKHDVNLHLYEEGHPEIELNLLFRDYLRTHPEARDEYGLLKEALLKEQSSYKKNNSSFTGYNHGKDAFIRKTLQLAGYSRLRMLKCAHPAEWDAVKNLRLRYFFGSKDPYTWTFDHSEHAHLILVRGMEIAGYAHIQFWPDHRAALRIIVIDENFRNHGFGSQFLGFIEKWLKKQGIKSLHDESRPDAVKFYQNNGYIEMPFNDPSNAPPSPHDIALGKYL